MKPKSKKKQTSQKQKFLKRNVIIIIALFLLIFSLILLISSIFNSNQTTKDQSDIPKSTSNSDIQQGKALAFQYCQTCHILPYPALLDKNSWKNVLPKMGLKMGIKSHKGESYEYADPGLAEGSNYYPDHPAMNETKWQNIIDYYVASAPGSLPPQNRSAIKEYLPYFSALPAPDFLSRKNLMVTYVKIDNSVKPSRLFVFEQYSKQLFLLNHQLKVMDSIKIDGIIVDMNFYNKEILAVSMSTKFNSLDREKIGKVFPLIVSKSGKLQIKPPIFENLAMPIQITPADLNGDHQTDYLICEFGFLTGALTWMENQGAGKYVRHVIRNFPGSTNAIIRDIRHNGRPDFWVLFGQGEEGIFHFINKGNGQFDAKEVLRFPSVYGSTSFEMVDMNHDGFEDIIYTCGDNGDFSNVLKPYHGVYIFINDGKYNFTQKYFYPINGCYKVIAKDFRNSGNIDLATIAFFTDANQPKESFVYLKNDGNLNFSPYTLPQGANFERFLTMDSGDFDNDGKPDLILGNTYPFPGKPGYNKKEPLFVVLKNLGK